VCKNELKCYISIGFDIIIVDNVEIECILGDTDSWGDFNLKRL